MVIHAHIPGAALEAEVKRLVEEWRVICPREYAMWDANCRAQRDFLRDARAWSAGKTMRFEFTLPAHVSLCIGRFLQDHNWTKTQPKAVEIVLSVLQNARMPVKKA